MHPRIERRAQASRRGGITLLIQNIMELLHLNFASYRSRTLPVHGLFARFERFLVTGDASVSHLRSTGEHGGRGDAKIYSGPHHSWGQR